MIYLGQPYSDPDPTIRYIRYQQGMATAAALFNKNLDIYAPVVHWHEAACRYNLPKDAGFWQRHNFHMLDLADELYILTLSGWSESIGVLGEVIHAVERDIPISFVTLTPNSDAIVSSAGDADIQGLTDGQDRSERGTGRRTPRSTFPGREGLDL